MSMRVCSKRSDLKIFNVDEQANILMQLLPTNKHLLSAFYILTFTFKSFQYLFLLNSYMIFKITDHRDFKL